MMLLREKVVLSGVQVEIQLDDKQQYCLRHGDIVEYRNGMKRVRGRATAYEFRSVEQLRYDFERDVEAA